MSSSLSARYSPPTKRTAAEASAATSNTNDGTPSAGAAAATAAAPEVVGEPPTRAATEPASESEAPTKKPNLDDGGGMSNPSLSPRTRPSQRALEHVLVDVCELGEGSAVLTVFRTGVISDIDALCNLTDEEVYALVRLGVGGGAPAATASATATAAATPMTLAQLFEISKIRMLKAWRSHLRREGGGISPRDGDWLRLTSDDFRQFSEPDPDAATGAATGTSRLAIEDAARRARAFVESIIGQEPEPIEGSDGMSVMKNVLMLEGGEVEADVVIRKVTRPFWQACIDAVDPPAPDSEQVGTPTTRQQLRVCAVGTPGVGKTSCTPYLIKMLLELKRTVVYHVRSEEKDEWIYEFIPGPDGRVTANVYPEQAFHSGVPSLKDRATFYVVDPGKFNGSCDPKTGFRPKVIIVASPDSKHWGNGEFFKNRYGVKGVLKFFPVWELDELLQARLVMGSTITVEQVEDRYSHVGGVPRHVFDTVESFKEALARQEKAVTLLTAQQVKDVSVKFARKAIVEDTFDALQPKSALIGYRVSDDDKGTFSDYRVEVIATHAFARIIRRFMMDMWQDLCCPSFASPWLFEVYTRYLIASKSTKFTCRRGVGKRDPGRKSIKEVALGGRCKEVRLVGDIVAAAKKRKMVVFHSVNLNNPLIDFLFQDSEGHFHAFQVTLAEKHPAKVAHILALEQLVGDPNKLSLYFLVPESRFEKFVTEPVDPSEEGATCNIYHVSVEDPKAEAEPEEAM